MLHCDEDLGKKCALRRWCGDAFGPLGFLATFFVALSKPDEKAPEVPLQDIEPLLDDARTSATLLVGCPLQSTDRMVVTLVDHSDPHKQIG